jgi:hypothetical protein
MKGQIFKLKFVFKDLGWMLNFWVLNKILMILLFENCKKNIKKADSEFGLHIFNWESNPKSDQISTLFYSGIEISSVNLSKRKYKCTHLPKNRRIDFSRI